ncbi:MAG: methyltransferase domain-containing protein [Chloroflexota bacterium]|nr:MAG: methyltransferase domain-containing protein [Chloroflexota bacterium]
MSQQDRDRWNNKWASAGDDTYLPHPLLIENAGYLTGGEALDLACGRGQNAIWLGRQGYRVLGVDISPVALQFAQSEAAAQELTHRVSFQIVDLDAWLPPPNSYDLICVFRFLDRRLFGPIREGVRSGGLVFYSTRHLGALDRHPSATEAYLLRPGELAVAFSDWHILHEHEGAEDAELIARKPLKNGPSSAPAD